MNFVESDDLPPWAEVLASESYVGFCALLRPLFDRSRKPGLSPIEMIEVQEGLAGFLFGLAEKRKEFKAKSDQIGVLAVKRMELMTKSIADSMAWRALRFDRRAVGALSAHNPTGDIDESTVTDLEIARELATTASSVVVADLTTILRHGDLLEVRGRRITLRENKRGKSGRRDRRAIRQAREGQSVTELLNTGFRATKYRTDATVRVTVRSQTYHEPVRRLIEGARQEGYVQAILSVQVR
jgi:hypothetical protein